MENNRSASGQNSISVHVAILLSLTVKKDRLTVTIVWQDPLKTIRISTLRAQGSSRGWNDAMSQLKPADHGAAIFLLFFEWTRMYRIWIASCHGRKVFNHPTSFLILKSTQDVQVSFMAMREAERKIKYVWNLWRINNVRNPLLLESLLNVYVV